MPFGLILLLVVVGTTIWVGVDSTKRDWPEGANGTTTWVLGCVLLWIVFFPFYLVKRSKTTPIGAPVQALPHAALYRECPHCKEPMRRDATVCPHCRNESPAWTLHDSRWWFRANEQATWQWFDEQSGSWVMHEPSPLLDPV